MWNKYLMVVLIILAFNLIEAADSRLELTQEEGGHMNRPQREISCRENQEYPHGNICCLNCPAGTHVKSACTSAFERGTCEICDFDSYTEHDNGLLQCLKCTKCRPDQETVQRCTTTQNTECQCKPGHFCVPDQACEVCKWCSTCKDDEVQVRNCTPNSNTVCKRRQSISGNKSVITTVVILLALSVAAIAGLIIRKKRKFNGEQDSQSNPSEMEKALGDNECRPSDEEMQNRVNYELDDSKLHPLLTLIQSVGHQAPANKEEDNGLGTSLPSTTNSSLASLPSLPSAPPSAPSPHPCVMFQRHPDCRCKDLLQRKLVPLNGDVSLSNCFVYFEELDVRYHNRFFRHIGLNENAIKSRDHLQPEDRVHELLLNWREKAGMKASLNDLIAALLYFNQRLSAENIIAKAIAGGQFEYAENQKEDESQAAQV